MNCTIGCKTVVEFVEDVLAMNRASLLQIIEDYNIKSNPSYPQAFISSLTAKDLTIALRTVVIAFHTTISQEIPRGNQLEFVVKSINRDPVLIAGTGSRKTLAIALLVHLVSRQRITITISPLKRLQIIQAQKFLCKYKIPTIVVNEETPCGLEYWTMRISRFSRTKTVGPYRHLVVTTEQLFKMQHGHFSQLGLFINIRTQAFRKAVARFRIDEAHFIHFAGLPRFSLLAFQPTWGRLNEIKILFPKVPFNTMTATSPPHALRAIENVVLQRNLTYATHCVVNSLEQMKNFIPTNLFLLKNQKQVLVFFDCIKGPSLLVQPTGH
ncbi:hypothetical protein L218DRAFT_949530 [Marasmius fiardii PR-910]|nr:hypothetical protein L218DRAFT_949530 [Marasmius fiardii PR-910]